MKAEQLIKCIAVLMVVLLSGCATMQGAVTEKIDNRQVEYALAKHGSATIVFESGLWGKSASWAKVFTEISKDTTAFAYSRPGHGKSNLVSTPRDGAHIVQELRMLLRSKGLHPPYVLVGHSLGGLYMQLFARRYPEEVKALILVDSAHPDQLKGKGAPENWSTGFHLIYFIATSAVEKEEANGMNATGESVLSLPSFTGKPVIVLSALQPMKEKSGSANDANEKRKDIVRLYPGARQIWVDSGHNIHLEKPESVIAAIREVLSLTQSLQPKGNTRHPDEAGFFIDTPVSAPCTEATEWTPSSSAWRLCVDNRLP
jgi:pimeloyl-ACP methyl ester carboxylesterase